MSQEAARFRLADVQVKIAGRLMPRRFADLGEQRGRFAAGRQRVGTARLKRAARRRLEQRRRLPGDDLQVRRPGIEPWQRASSPQV